MLLDIASFFLQLSLTLFSPATQSDGELKAQPPVDRPCSAALAQGNNLSQFGQQASAAAPCYRGPGSKPNCRPR
jgi:hypothetical protein